MRIAWRACAVLAAAACSDAVAPPVSVDRVGTPLGYEGGAVDLAWVPGTRLVAFRVPATDSTACGIRTLHVDSGRVASLDDGCTTIFSFSAASLRGLAVSRDGSAIAWHVGVAGADPFGGAVRASTLGAAPIEYKRAVRMWPSVALSPDGRSLAFAWSLADTMVVRDLPTGTERRVEAARPLAFSPDGQEVAYLVSPGGVRRRAVADIGESVVPLALRPGDALGPVTWDATGLWAMVDRLGGGIYLRNTGNGLEVLASRFEFGQRVRFPSWSPDGTRFAFWEEVCRTADVGSPCTVEHARLVVVDRDTARRVTVAGGPAEGGPLALSPGGREIVYRFGGAFYRDSVSLP